MANPNLRVDPTRTGLLAFFASDRSEPRFFIEGSIRSEPRGKILSFIVVAQLTEGTRGSLTGGEFFTAMMDHFGNGTVDAIEGQWETTNPDWLTNLLVFNSITGSTTLTDAEAAELVPTGKYAGRRGFSNVTVVKANPAGARGRYTEVLVRFRK